jgi:putative serine protease PepD
MLVRRAISLAIVLGLAVATAACGESNDNAAPASRTVTVHTAAEPKTASSGGALTLQSRFVRVVANVSPAVVQIETETDLGSGIVYDGKGNIVTNAHVVGTATTFTVTFSDGARRSAKLVGSFPPNDLAVIRVSGDPPPAARFGNSSELLVGDIVLAIGNPLGLRSSVTEGIVSSLGRTVSEGNGVALPSVIQTSAAINPGNSGGALVNLASEVIGIPTLAAIVPEFGQAAPGIGFAIPSNTVKRVADQLIRFGKVTRSGRAFLGVRVATVMGGGVHVTSVTPGGPAASAGMKAGDVIVSVDGTPVPSTDDLVTVLAQIKPGTKVPVEIVRNGKKVELEVTVGQLESG